MAEYKLYKWQIIGSTTDPFVAPESNPPRLFGYRDNETVPVRTSPIAHVNGNIITTYSGSVYILEDIDPDYFQWIIDNNISFDPLNPIRIIKDKNESSP